MSLPPPDYSAPKPIRPPHINASASSSRSSSRARRRPRGPSRQNTTDNLNDDAFHWCPSPPMDEKTRLPSSVTITMPPGNLICLVTPPKVDPLGEDDWGDVGRDGRLEGVITVHSHKRKVYPGPFVLSLVGTQRLSFSPDCTTPHEDTEVFRREIELDGSEEEEGDIVIERGISTYKFSIRVPASSALSDRCKNGRIIYHTTATIVGSGSMFKPDITGRKESWVMCNPQDEDRMLQYQNHQEGISDLLGPYALALTSSEFLVGAALGVSLTLAYPPKTLTIFALQVCIQQTIQLSRTPRDKVVEIKGPKKIVYSVGPKSGFAAKDFMEKARKQGEVVFDGMKEGGKTGRDSDGGWVLKEMGRLPNDDDIRPTTLPGTKTSMRFRSDLTVEVVCNHAGSDVKDESLKIVTMLREEDVFITSCICMLDRISLPSYTRDDQPDAAEDARPICRCLEQWDSLRQHELIAQKTDPESESSPRGWVEDSKGGEDSGGERRSRWDGVGGRGVGAGGSSGSGGGRRKIGEIPRGGGGGR